MAGSKDGAQAALEEQNRRIRALYLIAAEDSGSSAQVDATLTAGCRWFGFECGYVGRREQHATTVMNAVGAADAVVTGATCKDGVPLALWKSCFEVPLRVHRRKYGAMVFADRVARADLSEADSDLAHLMGFFVSAALERAEHEARVEQLAFHDTLTGLPNRALFDDRIRQTMATAKRYGRGFAVMFLDLDRFKEVNDTLGHAAGDRLLQLVAGRLRATLRESDTVGRFGGDEFVILQPIVDGPDDASKMARKIIEAMQAPFDLHGAQREVHTSLGISLYPQDGGAVEALLERADRALYQAKESGRNRWAFFEAPPLADPEKLLSGKE